MSLSKTQIVDVLRSEWGNGREYHTPKHMWYFREPQRNSLPINLKAGFENYKFWTVDNKKEFIPIQTYLMKNTFKRDKTKTTIFTCRAALYNLMMAPYPSGSPEWDDFTLSVIKFRDVIFIAQFNYEIRNKPNDTYHYKFKQHCFVNSPNALPNTSEPIDENKQFLYLYRSQFNDFDMLYTADMGGIMSDIEIKDLSNMNEINKCRLILTQMTPDRPNSSNLIKNSKALPWWIKANLCNVNDIYVGFKDKSGCMRRPGQHILVQDLPKNQKWKSEHCFQSLHRFLTEIKDKLFNVDCPYTVHEFKFDSKKKSTLLKIHKGETHLSFLTEEFIEHMRKM